MAFFILRGFERSGLSEIGLFCFFGAYDGHFPDSTNRISPSGHAGQDPRQGMDPDGKNKNLPIKYIKDKLCQDKAPRKKENKKIYVKS